MSEKEKKENEVKGATETKKEEKVSKEVKEEKAKEPKKTEDKKVEKPVENTKKIETKKEEKREGKKAENTETKTNKVEEKKEEQKKFEVKTNQKKKTASKKTHWVATAITIIAVLAVAALLTYMIVTSSDPKKTVDGFLTNLKAGDFTKAQEFVSGDEDLLSDEEFDDETKALLFDKLSWKVTKVTKEDSEATVEVEVTNKNFDTIISNCMKKLLEDFKAILNGASVEQNMDKYFTEELKNEQVETTTVTKTIQLVKEDKTWKVVSNDELVDALLPGLQESINELN
jgi:anti-sigma-K factor RskA